MVSHNYNKPTSKQDKEDITTKLTSFSCLPMVTL